MQMIQNVVSGDCTKPLVKQRQVSSSNEQAEIRGEGKRTGNTISQSFT